LGKTIVKIQVGAGPCGELRYPSYVPKFGWKFPGIGVFPVYDKYAKASLTTAGSAKHWTGPPSDAGDYNSQPQQTGFFNGGYESDYGKFFLGWYLDTLKTHGSNVLDQAALAFKGRVGLAAKIAGIHWWYGDTTHAAEVTAGYYNTNNRNAYKELAEVFARNQVALDFTCLEMRDSEQDQSAKSRPEELVQQVINAAVSSGILFSGENALPRYDDTAYQQILKYRQHLHAFTYLRASDQLFGGDDYVRFKNFVQQMHSGTYEAMFVV
jgi:beta-amylase